MAKAPEIQGRSSAGRSSDSLVEELRRRIEAAYADRKLLADAAYPAAVREVIALLDAGKVRVASKEKEITTI